VSVRIILTRSPEGASCIYVKYGAHHKEQMQLGYFEGNKKKVFLFNVTVGIFINGRIDAVGLPNIAVFTVGRYATVYSYLQ
jgi:hypothetical protein